MLLCPAERSSNALLINFNYFFFFVDENNSQWIVALIHVKPDFSKAFCSTAPSAAGICFSRKKQPIYQAALKAGSGVN